MAMTNIPELRALLSRRQTWTGVDPGLSGAVVRIGNSEEQPLLAFRDFKGEADIANAVKECMAGQFQSNVIIEAVHAMPGQGVCSMFSFGKSTGVAHGAYWARQVPGDRLFLVSPQKWQNWIKRAVSWPEGEPFDSRAIATEIFSEHAHLFKRKKDHNSSDAALIALWGLANHENHQETQQNNSNR